jgi:hypothetical protein
MNSFSFEKKLIKLIYIYETIRRELNKKTRKKICITFYKIVIISALRCNSVAMTLVKKAEAKERKSKYSITYECGGTHIKGSNWNRSG